MRIIAIDPGAAFGIAVCIDGSVTHSDQRKMPQERRIGHAVALLSHHVSAHGPIDLVTVEMPAVLGRASSFEGLASQWSNVLAWWHAAEMLGLRVEWVNPASWRAMMVRRVKATLLPHEDAKSVMQLPQAELSTRALGYGVGNDECAAIWMALWANEHADELTPDARKATKDAKKVAKKAAKAKKQAKDDLALADAVALADRSF